MIALLLAFGVAANGTCQGALDSSKTCTITFSATTTGGNDVVVGISWESHVQGTVSPTISTVVDSGGSTYSQKGTTVNDPVAGQQLALYAAHGIAASTTLTVTLACAGCTGCTGNTGCMFIGLVAQEYSGVAAFGHTTSAQVTSANTAASISDTIQAANNWLVGLSDNSATGAITTTTGTQRVTNAGGTSDAVTISDSTAGSPGSVSVAWSGPSSNWNMLDVELCASNPCVAAASGFPARSKRESGFGR